MKDNVNTFRCALNARKVSYITFYKFDIGRSVIGIVQIKHYTGETTLK